MSDSFDLQGLQGLACPISSYGTEVIKLGHGSGGKMTSDLIEHLFRPELGNEILNQADDAAILSCGGATVAVTTDAYVVNPVIFPGGDIGSLAVHGTVNDLAMRGARPLYLTISFIIEEGFRLETLRRIAGSVNRACAEAGVCLVCADTKVVNRGAADGLFISASGVGLVESAFSPGAGRARPGDIILVSGDVGRHGMAIMCAREGLELESTIESDSAPLNHLVASLVGECDELHCLRDLTRGGLATAANELAISSGVAIELEERAIAIDPQVKGACEILGLDPLYVACEGRFMAIVPAAQSDRALSVLQRHPLGQNARICGRVVDGEPNRVTLITMVGGRRYLGKLSGEQLPRIC